MESALCQPLQEKVSSKVLSAARDMVKVYCRIMPLRNNESCVKVTSPTAVSLQLPQIGGASHRRENYKEIHYTFKHVFDDTATQMEVLYHVALPLVQNLIDGKNGLIFTYGVTGSGKTFTMSGHPQDGGIVPRCLDVIFNSLSSYQATTVVFKPDRRNGFDIQSETARSLKTQIKKESDADLSQRTPVGTKIESVKGYNNHAVFVTNIEIYNNAMYDLLDVPKNNIRRM
jgi:kinesin family protein 23